MCCNHLDLHVLILSVAARAGKYTSFLYVEGRHPGDVAGAGPPGAVDTEILEPLGWLRGFVRTGIMPDSGSPGLEDERQRLDLGDASAGGACGGGAGRDNPQHGTFCSCQTPYTGDVGRHGAAAGAFYGQPVLGAAKAACTCCSRGGTMEMASNNYQFVSIPKAGFLSAALVPFCPHSKRLDPVSRIEHLPNTYCAGFPFNATWAADRTAANPLGEPCAVAYDEF